MKRFMVVMTVLLIITIVLYGYMNNREFQVIDAHHGEYTAQILVNHLPLSTSESIDWWVNNQSAILTKYKIRPSNAGGPWYIKIFSFGDGYQESGREDRLCFEDVPPPKNCIDKDILMSIDRTRDGETKIRRRDAIYILTKEGGITKSKND